MLKGWDSFVEAPTQWTYYKKIMRNNWYIVMIRDGLSSFGPCEQALIRRNDALPHFHWWHLQMIKNECWGTDHVGIQVFPKEEKVVDNFHIYWMWVFSPEQNISFSTFKPSGV